MRSPSWAPSVRPWSEASALWEPASIALAQVRELLGAGSRKKVYLAHDEQLCRREFVDLATYLVQRSLGAAVVEDGLAPHQERRASVAHEPRGGAPFSAGTDSVDPCRAGGSASVGWRCEFFPSMWTRIKMSHQLYPVPSARVIDDAQAQHVVHGRR